MSQRLVIVEVDDNVIPENFWCVPDHDEAVHIVMDFVGDDYEDGENFYVKYWWYEIGDGESGMDEFVSENELFEIWQYADFEKELGKLGYSVELIEDGEYTVDSDELERDYW